MKQAENKVVVEGFLNAIDLKEKVYEGKKAVAGNVEIAVPNEIGEMDIIPISVFVNEKKKDGGANPIYKGIQTFQSEFKSIAATGDKNLADKVRVTNGSIRMNEFYSQNGNLVSSPQITSNFFNHATGEFTPQAKFSSTIVVCNIEDEIDKNGDETGRLIVKGVLVGYADRVDIVTFYVENKESIEYISRNWELQKTYMVRGKVRFKVETVQVPVEVGFGEPQFETKTYNVKEFIITSGSAEGLSEDEGGYDTKDIAAALKARKERLAEMKDKQKKKEKNSIGTNAGFGDLDINDDF